MTLLFQDRKAPHFVEVTRPDHGRIETRRIWCSEALNGVHHFPPGTSKWNKIEHRLFSFITMNWRGRPLVSHEVIVNLIANTKTRSGLTVQAELDTAEYPKGLVISDAQMADIKIDRNQFHGDWNYCIRSD